MKLPGLLGVAAALGLLAGVSSAQRFGAVDLPAGLMPRFYASGSEAEKAIFRRDGPPCSANSHQCK